MTLLGLPYHWGGDDPILGFDCSGGVIEVLTGVGLFLHGDDMKAIGLKYKYPSVATAAPGVLSFYGPGEWEIAHVGMCINNEIMFEFGGGRSSTRDEDDAARANAFGRLRPIHYRDDLVGFCDPFAESA